MISLSITDIKSFMSHLLVKNTFDSLFISEVTIATANTYNISGKINTQFFSKDELDCMNLKKYSFWNQIKPFCFTLIKGHKVPSYMKLVFLLSDNETRNIIDILDTPLEFDCINGLFINVKYQSDQISLTTGTSLNIFSLNKELDAAFDRYICNFLSNANIEFETI